MTSVPSFLPRPLSTVPCFAVGVSLLGGLGVSGCFFELPELVPDAGIGGGGSGAQPPILGGSGGSLPGGPGGTSGTSGSDSCGAGTKQCGNEAGCASTTDPARGCGDPSCTPCQGPGGDNVVMGCSDDGQCQIQACKVGFADCDGEAIGKSGAEVSASNGCERAFGAVASGAEPLLVPFKTMQIDGERTDWNGIPVYAVNQPCVECDGTDDRTDPVVSPRNAPVPQDLSAYFRISWDTSNLYLLAEAFDDTPVKTGDMFREDGVIVFFDGLDNRVPGSTNGNDDNRIYIGISDAHTAVTRPLQAGQLTVVGKQDGLRCYRTEAQISWRYIVGFEGTAAQGKFPPTADETYGFDIAFSDWDPAPGDAEPSVVQFQNQVFWVDPGDEWWFRSQGWGGIKLLGDGANPSDAGVQ